jgi:hypothetical protein
MIRKSLLVLICVMGFILLLSTVHAQGSKKTITLPNGDVIYDLNGEWDSLWIGRGEAEYVGRIEDVVKITQQGNSFIGIRMMGNIHLAKGTVAYEGELDKNGFKKLIQTRGTLVGHESVPVEGKISNDGNTIEISENWFDLKLTRRCAR